MKRTSWLALIVTIIISAFLLWLWYYLGLNHVDDPLDLILSIIWWIMMVVLVVVVWRLEKKRRERMRSIYVGDRHLFNPEKGVVDYVDSDHLVIAMEHILEDITYSFNKEDLPDPDEYTFDFIVRTKKYKADSDDEEKNEWEGEVSYLGSEGDEERAPFQTRDELVLVIERVKTHLIDMDELRHSTPRNGNYAEKAWFNTSV